MLLHDLVSYLDEYLDIASVADYDGAYNGLQVDGRAEVRRVACCVDACEATIRMALEASADAMVVHHGLFWGAKAPVTDAYYRRLGLLLKNDLALYSCHLPLDAHSEVGNNHVLARRLGLKVGGMFAEHVGTLIGVWAEADLPRDEIAGRLGKVLGVTPRVIATGPAVVRRAGIITGGAGSQVPQAAAAGCDTLITGEGPHHTYFDAEERGLNLIYAGHYATETVGVRALAEHLERRFGLETAFLDHPTGL